MTTTTITAADAGGGGLVTTAGNDGTLTLQAGPAGGKVNAIVANASGQVSIPVAISTSAINGLTVLSTVTTPLPSNSAVGIAVSHSLGVVPFGFDLEIVCLTAEFGYSVGDVVKALVQWNGSSTIPLSIWASSTQCGFSFGSGYQFFVTNKTTGAAQTATLANWSYRFRLRTS